MVPPQKISVRCPGCGVGLGQLHNKGCTVPTCAMCGGQLIDCGHHPEGNIAWNGIQHLEEVLLASILDLYVKWGGAGWESCPADDPEAQYDLTSASELRQEALRRVRGML